jgi:hypothetical protein
MSAPLKWNEAADAILRVGFLDAPQDRLVADVQAAMGLPLSWHTIENRARRLGLSRGKPTGWSQEQQAYLVSHYAVMPMQALLDGLGERGLPKNRQQVLQYAGRRGMKREQRPRYGQREWTYEQNELLREAYMKWPATKLREALRALSPDGRAFTKSMITGRAHRMGLSQTKRELWTEEQASFIRQHYQTMGWSEMMAGVAERGEPKTVKAIKAWADRNKLPRPRHSRPASPTAASKARKIPAPVQRPPAPVHQPHLQTQKNGISLLASRPAPDLRTIAAGEPDTAHEKVVSKQEKAWNLLWKGRDASDVARDTGLMLREVLRINMDVREARRAQRAA